MRIAINTIPLLSPLTGVGSYTFNIAQSLWAIDAINDYTYFYGYYSRNLHAYYNENKKIFYQMKELVKKIPMCRGIVARELVGGFVNTASPRSFDLYFEPNFIPINIKARCSVVTIFDFSVALHPEWHPKERIDYFKKYFWKNIKRADRIIVISDYIKKEGVNLGLPEEKLRTIHLGCDREVFKTYPPQDLQSIRKKYGLPPHFMLFVGSIEPRKNLVNMIRAYVSLDKGIRKDIKLVLAGFKGWQHKEIMELLKKVKSDVVYLGYLPDTELGKLYNLATLFIYPSIYEGFGLPPLEAMACGCPVVVSNAASLPEVCGDAAQYVDPHDVNSIAGGIAKGLSDETLRRSLIARGLERAKLFSWEHAAKKHLEVFEDAAENCPHP
ncbi:MAG: hypothetical protein A2Y65_03055 [Deltaproteobacteria bacterium RBG_13_52_11]|nr:MAG: hypothetical protein A2Y65_03055 [Deltaproteobacteria bacterium RBG_13_52_11]